MISLPGRTGAASHPRRLPRRLTLVAAIALAGSAAAPASAADTLVTSGVGDNFDAFGGVFAWSQVVEIERGREVNRLVLRSSGRTYTPPLRTFANRPDPSIGRDAGGRTVVAYARCGERGCDLFELGVRGGRERKLTRLSTRRRAEQAPSVWNGHYAFVRSGRGGGLLKTSPVRRLSRSHPVETDLRGNRVAYLIEDRESRGVTLLVKRFDRRGRGRHCVVARANRSLDETLGSPALSGRFVYWVSNPVTLAPGLPNQASFVQRRRLPGSRCESRGRPEIVRRRNATFTDSVALDGQRVLYTTGSLLFEATDPPVRADAAVRRH